MVVTTETWIALAAAVFTVISVVIGLAAVFVRLGRWGQRLESRIDALGNRVEALDRRIDGFATWGSGFSKQVTEFFGLTVRLLHGRRVLDDTELSEVLTKQASLSQSAVDALFEKERRTENPLALEELERLRSYVYKARAGHGFTPEEVRDYNYLVTTLERDHPTDPGVWPLLALGAFLLGLYVGAKGRDS